jgi:hypothetical protein
MRDEVVPVTDAEDRNAARQQRTFDDGAGIIVDAVRTARDDNSPGVRKVFKRNFAREHFGRNSEFPNFTRDKVAVLTAGVEYGYLGQLSYFRILSTMIFFALLIRACAFGIASIACRTSGSFLISYLRLSSTLNAVL